MIAFSPGLSWLIFGAVVAVVVVVYFAASAWLDRREAWVGDLIREAHSQTWAEPRDPQLRIFGGPYDYEAKGDFE